MSIAGHGTGSVVNAKVQSCETFQGACIDKGVAVRTRHDGKATLLQVYAQGLESDMGIPSRSWLG